MQVFERSVTDYIAEQFYLYFRRKATGKAMSVEDAKNLIDFVQGDPAPLPISLGAIDYSKVSGGGGRQRPLEKVIEDIEDIPLWNEVFKAVIKWCDEENKNVIMLVFRDKMKEEKICKTLTISPRTLYDYRLTILTRAGVLAALKNLIEI